MHEHVLAAAAAECGAIRTSDLLRIVPALQSRFDARLVVVVVVVLVVTDEPSSSGREEGTHQSLTSSSLLDWEDACETRFLGFRHTSAKTLAYSRLKLQDPQLTLSSCPSSIAMIRETVEEPAYTASHS